jgi:predicted PurR-regulated permease PerM
MGAPIVDFLGKFEFKNIRIPKAIRAMFALISMWLVFIILISIFAPLIAQEANYLSNVDVNKIIAILDQPLKNIENFVNQYKLLGESNMTIEEYASIKIMDILGFTNMANIANTTFNILGNIFVAIFAISFITFFFLKDQNLFPNLVFAIFPDKYEDHVRNVLHSIKRLLIRYFIGMTVDVFLVITLITVGLTIVGIDFNQALIIGLFAGIFNVIPYIGPILAMIFGVTISFVSNLDLNFYNELVPLIIYVLSVFISVQIIDGAVFQPFIYSNSVNAHPLEIFLVILTAGSLGGIVAMIFAIPSYTVLRVIAKEFFSKLKIVQKLTEKI